MQRRPYGPRRAAMASNSLISPITSQGPSASPRPPWPTSSSTPPPTLTGAVRVCPPLIPPDTHSDVQPSVNPLTGEHVLVSPHRTKRPWQGQTEPPQQANLPQYDPQCYLCPGNTRAGGQQNDKYEHTMVFENDYAAVLPPPGPLAPPAPHPLLTTEPLQGGCDVICFHPRHDLTLARLPIPDIERVIETWIAVYKKRGAQEGIKYVQIFEVRPAILHDT